MDDVTAEPRAWATHVYQASLDETPERWVGLFRDRVTAETWIAGRASSPRYRISAEPPARIVK